MPRLKRNAVRSDRLHKQSGRAIVAVGGRDYLHGTDVNKGHYDRLIAE